MFVTCGGVDDGDSINEAANDKNPTQTRLSNKGNGLAYK